MIQYTGFLTLRGQYKALKIEFDEDNSLLDENAPMSQLLSFTRKSDAGNDIEMVVNTNEIAFLEYWEKRT